MSRKTIGRAITAIPMTIAVALIGAAGLALLAVAFARMLARVMQ